MHNAPAVSYPVGRSAMRAAWLGVPLLAGGTVGLLWVGLAGPLAWPHGLALLLWLAAAAAVLIELRRPCSGLLRWDGQHWQWDSRGRSQAGTVAVRLDWQRGLLLEFQALDGARRWLWPERRSAPLYWDALRRALYAPVAARADAPDTPAAGAGP